MYNIFYIYTYKYTKPSNMLTLSRSLNAHTSQERINSLISYTRSQEQNASHIYGAKMHKPHNATKPYSRATCIYTAILKNCIMRYVFQFYLCFVTTLKIFCNLFVICRAK